MFLFYITLWAVVAPAAALGKLGMSSLTLVGCFWKTWIHMLGHEKRSVHVFEDWDRRPGADRSVYESVPLARVPLVLDCWRSGTLLITEETLWNSRSKQGFMALSDWLKSFFINAFSEPASVYWRRGGKLFYLFIPRGSVVRCLISACTSSKANDNRTHNFLLWPESDWSALQLIRMLRCHAKFCLRILLLALTLCSFNWCRGKQTPTVSVSLG